MSQHHAAIKNDPRWKAARRATLERDAYACIECGSTELLEVDHILDLANHPELAFEVDNLQTLCKAHHELKTKAGPSVMRLAYVNPSYAADISDLVFSDRMPKTPAVSDFHPNQPE